MSERERIELAFALGEDDLARFIAASGLDRAEALRRLRAGHERGRVRSACAASSPLPGAGRLVSEVEVDLLDLPAALRERWLEVKD